MCILNSVRSTVCLLKTGWPIWSSSTSEEPVYLPCHSSSLSSCLSAASSLSLTSAEDCPESDARMVSSRLLSSISMQTERELSPPMYSSKGHWSWVGNVLAMSSCSYWFASRSWKGSLSSSPGWVTTDNSLSKTPVFQKLIVSGLTSSQAWAIHLIAASFTFYISRSTRSLSDTAQWWWSIGLI